jgi:hypothetical protein
MYLIQYKVLRQTRLCKQAIIANNSIKEDRYVDAKTRGTPKTEYLSEDSQKEGQIKGIDCQTDEN